MAKIRILPEQLANQIAAGEVVERPASVVKELVENSLDAGADRIEVEVEGGGTRLIRVLDNGSGMDEDDILLCFERHGTSKISRTDDLAAINSLGFRGEAIPSIASVSKVSIISKTRESDLGTKVVFEYGRLQKVQETGCSSGTDIEVRGLFARTPARKKFLRTARTELGHIDEILKNYALASPQTAFSLHVNGKETLILGSGHDLEHRLRSILNYDGMFIDVGDGATDFQSRGLRGFLVPPERSISGSAKLRLFINGRSIRDRLMTHAIFEGLRGFLLKGRGPAGYLHLRVPAEEIDVNVHPAKHEVRFRNSGDIHQFIKQKVAEAMHGYQQSIRSAYFRPQAVKDGGDPGENRPGAPESSAAAETGSLRRENSSPPESRPLTSRRPSLFNPPYRQGENERPGHLETAIPLQTREAAPAHSQEKSRAARPANSAASSHGLQVIGQFLSLYIFCQAGDELLVIDQHAAHERLLYERLRSQYRKGKVASQTLLFPETVELSPLQIERVENNGEELAQLGFSLGEFGGNSYVISAVPALAGNQGAAAIFFDVLEQFGSEKTGDGSYLDHVLATMACKAAVKSGDNLTPAEIDALLDAMAAADLFSHCPHGRPVLKTFSEKEIKKWFSRT